ncbi:MAG TPA: hypothetical protein ENI23_05905 [bacterium]|nr:hypothetical protein [bacterium]
MKIYIIEYAMGLGTTGGETYGFDLAATEGNVCSHCGSELLNELGDEVCPNCGAPIEGKSQVSLDAAPAGTFRHKGAFEKDENLQD